jgi:tRNA 5-methylaminomethyl-2-thiouridine biosynthesis bifunctional protein
LANSGWLHPEALCRTLINEQPLITLQEDCGLLSLVLENNEWHAIDNAGVAVARAASAVIATGTGSTAMAQTRWLPLRTIRGQTTDLAATACTKQLRAVLCHEGYIAPAREGVHCVGASFNLDSMEKSNNRDDHRDNLNKLSSAVPSWKAPLDDIDCDSIPGNVGFRCASLDYLPTVGPVPDTMGFSQNYAALRENAKQVIDTRGSYLHNLYITAGHGSRGLTSTPICAELLASIMCNEPLPLERDICRALSPARFIIRDLVRDRKF